MSTPPVVAPCHLPPKDKKQLVGAVGKDLVEKHGKQKYYKPPEVRRSAERCGYGVDVHCWAYVIFTTPQDFAAIHEAAGEACDYAAMKAEVLADLAGGASFSLFDVDLSWLDWPDISLSSLFDWFDVS
ncbi:MAG: hypothetical protein AVDCRST_MAG64-75 [uncultured Phycisphaerae bacterium]|uniref:Uncharacterized protein n=1 Tax=uncultured Phycisphaerae bacterium TaxID=904963 RepID=A0A6J4MZ24_9BACT|nr:MAG: hypothetical protein AVDCRST_MAG64-75 [uncultured Phycisphaerae bacterium]